MDPLRNPYAPGAGVKPPQLAGRDADLDAFRVVLERVGRGLPERSLMISGLRGVGKTVLLREFQSLAEQYEWSTAKLEGREGMSLRGALGRAVHLLLRSLNRRHRLEHRFEQLLGVLKSFVITASPGGEFSLKLEADPEPGRADSGDDEVDLTELLIEVGKAAASVHTGVAIFIDELQDLRSEDLAAIVGAFHEISQQQLPVLLAGAGLPHLPQELSESKTYAERLFRYRNVDSLSMAAATEALVVPAQRLGVEFTEPAIEAVLDASGGYPYFIQAYGKHIWDVADRSPIDLEDVQLGANEARRELDVGFFGTRWDRATPKEREYLQAMAELGEQPTRSAAVAAHLGKPAGNLSVARDQLLKKGLIYSPGRGLVSFTVPRFGEFILSRQD
ncbi:MAG: ATP-binding protein [bacterium]|nr:ATP-binding protein [bacterium]MCP4966573.1 ATP-binding protein [bacterium]